MLLWLAFEEYWKKNKLYLIILLSIWAFISFGLCVIWVDDLDKFSFLDFKLGFWFAQQGAIYSYVILIITYIFLMNKLDQQLKK